MKRQDKRTNDIKPIGEVISDSKVALPVGIETDYSDVELTEEEIRQALEYKRRLKFYAMEEDKRREATQARIRAYKKPFTAKELEEEVMFRTTQLPFEFVLDAENQRVFELMCLYYSGDERFDKEEFIYGESKMKMKLSLKKGIGLVSNVKGTGKSILMSLFQQNKSRPYLQMETKIVASKFMKDGESAIEQYSSLLPVAPTPSFFFHNHIGICFDDLGFEVPKNSYGSKSDVLADVLFKIYSKCQHHGEFSWFHFTSNLYGNEFEQRYDSRIRDRMREMFNTLVLTGTSRRK